MPTTATNSRTRYAFTKAQALQIALEVMSANPDTVDMAINRVLGGGRKPDHTADNATRRISHEVHVLAASSRHKGESAASKRNTNRANEWATIAADLDSWTLNEVCDHFNLVTNKGGVNYAAAVAIVNKLSDLGKLEKLPQVKGKSYYRIKAA